MGIKEDILAFHFSERAKSELIIASKLLYALRDFKDQAFEGAKKLYLLFLDSVLTEVGFGFPFADLREAEERIREAMGFVELGEFEKAGESFSSALSSITTRSELAMRSLMEKGLL